MSLFKKLFIFFILAIFAVGIFTMFSMNRANQSADNYTINQTTVNASIAMSGSLNSSTASGFPPFVIVAAILFIGAVFALGWRLARGK